MAVSKKYKITVTSGAWKGFVNSDNKISKLGEPKLFTLKEAQKWLKDHQGYIYTCFDMEVVTNEKNSK